MNPWINSVPGVLAVACSLVALSFYLLQFKLFKSLGPALTCILFAMFLLNVGLYLSLFYLSKIGFEIDLREFLNSATAIVMFCFVVMFGSFIIHIILCRFSKIKWQYVSVAMQAAIGSSSSAAALAVASGWESLIAIAIVLGVLGNAVDNYLGFGIACMLKSLLEV